MSFRAFAVAPIALVLALVLSCGAAPARAGTGEQIWLALADVHLDAYDRSAQPALVGSDTNLALWHSVLTQMKHDVPNPAVVLLPGDFFVHDFERAFRHSGTPGSADEAGIATMRLIASDLNRTYPKARFIIALGNNDVPCGDYRSVAGGVYLDAVARIWEPLVNREGAAPGFVAAFDRGGYYEASLPTRNLRAIVLNTVVLSSRFGGLCDGRANVASAQMAWLNATLHGTPAGERNVVVMHIPPGFDAFTTQAARGALAWPFLRTDFNDALNAAIAAPDNEITFAVAAHTHRFDFRIAGAVPIVVIGAVSPVYHNNPAFYALHVGAGGSLRDIEVYPFDEYTLEWAAPRSFDAKWNLTRIDATTLAGLHARLGTDPALRRAWDAGTSNWPTNTGSAWTMWRNMWRVPWCAQTVLGDGFTQCAGIGNRVFLARSLVAVAGVLLATIVVGVVLAILRRRRAPRQRA